MDNRVAELAGRLEETGYLCDDDLATVVFLSQEMGRPLLLEGEPGTGKTALAEALAMALEQPLIRLQCYEGIDATQALYDWDFPRQILHLRALEALSAGPGPGGLEEAEKSLYDERFLLARPVLAALQQSPAVLLVDEVDRADDEFEAFLLEVLSTYQITLPELGDKLLGQFVACLEERLATGDSAVAGPDTTPDTEVTNAAATDAAAAGTRTGSAAADRPGPPADSPDEEALDLGAAMLPVLLRSYAKPVALALAALLVLRLVIRVLRR